MGSHFLTLVRAGLAASGLVVPTDSAGQENERAPELIRAFRRLCEAAGAARTFELYEDDEATPALWSLAWEEWDGPDPFQLPLSPHGAPGVTFHRALRLEALVTRLRASAGEYVPRFIGEKEMSSLVEFLTGPARDDEGLFAFIEH